MKLTSWLSRSFKGSSLKRATLPATQINSDELPDAAHQDLIHELAKEYLDYFGNLAAMKARHQEMDEYFKAHPLLGLEITDEALVLLKNNPNRFTNARLAFLALPGLWRTYDDEVTRLRGGRRRPTTTPTLRGGGRRV